jgi:chromosome segregation ATPase
MFLGHGKCRDQIHQLTQTNVDNTNQILALNDEITKLLGQIHELKAINHYQAYELEEQIVDLKHQLSSYKCTPESCRKYTETETTLTELTLLQELKVKSLEEQNRSLKSEIKALKRKVENGQV